MRNRTNRAAWLVAVFTGALLGGGCGDDGHVFPEGGYTLFSETGLYSNTADKKFSSDVLPWTVTHPLWSDGAVKNRWVRLPAGTKIDTSTMNDWELPVGAQMFKEFNRDGVRVETRLIERINDTGVREKDYWVGAFLWNDDESEANFVVDGFENGRGTEHDVPAQIACWRCHRGQPGNILGFSALQLAAADTGTTLSDLDALDLLTVSPDRDYRAPGDEATSKVLGYLHANCGHCHNPSGLARIDTNLFLELSIEELTPEETQIYQTTVGVELDYWIRQDQFTHRVVAGDPDASALPARMMNRTSSDAMPPLATELIHAEGITIVRDWISNL